MQYAKLPTTYEFKVADKADAENAVVTVKGISSINDTLQILHCDIIKFI